MESWSVLTLVQLALLFGACDTSFLPPGPKSTETGRYVYENNTVLGPEVDHQHCRYCPDEAFDNTELNIRYQQPLCNNKYTNILKEISPFERDNKIYPLCKTGKVPGCGRPPVEWSTGDTTWRCDPGYSGVKYSVYFSCVICDKTKNLALSYYCNEQLIWELDSDVRQPELCRVDEDDIWSIILIVFAVMLLSMLTVVGVFYCRLRMRNKGRSLSSGSYTVDIESIKTSLLATTLTRCHVPPADLTNDKTVSTSGSTISVDTRHINMEPGVPHNNGDTTLKPGVQNNNGDTKMEHVISSYNEDANTEPVLPDGIRDTNTGHVSVIEDGHIEMLVGLDLSSRDRLEPVGAESRSQLVGHNKTDNAQLSSKSNFPVHQPSKVQNQESTPDPRTARSQAYVIDHNHPVNQHLNSIVRAEFQNSLTTNSTSFHKMRDSYPTRQQRVPSYSLTNNGTDSPHNYTNVMQMKSAGVDMVSSDNCAPKIYRETKVSLEYSCAGERPNPTGNASESGFHEGFDDENEDYHNVIPKQVIESGADTQHNLPTDHNALDTVSVQIQYSAESPEQHEPSVSASFEINNEYLVENERTQQPTEATPLSEESFELCFETALADEITDLSQS